jgi:hypothetical protein
MAHKRTFSEHVLISRKIAILKDSVPQLACRCKGILSRYYPLLLPTTSLRLRAKMENNEHKKKLARECRREIDAEYRKV